MNSPDVENASPQPEAGYDTFFKLIENAPFGVYLVDSQFCLQQVSAGAQRVFENVRPLKGRDLAEALRIIWTEPYASDAIARFRHTLATGEPYGNPVSTETRSDLKAVETYDWRIERVTLPGGEYGVVCYFNDITDRHAAQARESFLNKLSHQLALAADTGELVRTATRMVGEYLGVNRCYFLEIAEDGINAEALSDWRNVGPDLAGHYYLPDFGSAEWLAALQKGPVAIDDLRRHPWTKDFAEGYAVNHVQAYATTPFFHEGKWVAAFGVTSDVPRHWKPHEITTLENVAARVWPLVERSRVADALKLSEERFRTLFYSIDEGFCIIEMILDEGGKPVDYRFVSVNPLFEQFTGLSGAIGKTALEMVPDLEYFWIETYGKVALTGETLRFENCSEPMQRWFDVHASRIGGPGSLQVAIVFTNITERKKSERDLAQLTEKSEKVRRFYETILSTTPDLVYVFNLKHQFSYANEALLKMWGMTWEQAKFKTCLEIGYPEWHAAMHSREIEQVIATKQPIRGEVPFSGTNGRRIYDYIFMPVIDTNGEVEAIAGTTRDVTDIRNAAESLSVQTAQFETLLNQAPMGMYLVDDQFKLIQVNPNARLSFGDIPDLIGRDFGEILHILWYPSYAEEVIGIFRHTLETGEPYATSEIAELRHDLERTEYYQWRVDRMLLPSGRYGVVCYFTDISAQVHARAKIATSEERFRTLVSVIADLPWTANAEGAFSEPQPAWESFTGQSWAAYQDFGWINAFHPDDQYEIKNFWRQACATGSLFECDGQIWHAPSSQWRYFTARATPIRNADGSIREWVGACTDMDVLKRSEAALRIARDEAEKVSRAKDHFLAVLSHELRTPLTPVLMTVAAMEHDPALGTEAREDIAMVKRNIELETKLIDDLLDLSRITTGKLSLKLETVDLHEVIRRVFTICLPQAQQQEVKLIVKPASAYFFVEGDAARLQQILWNVVRNAIKFTPAGGQILVTTASLALDRCEIRVQDTGVGIPPESLPHVFDAFEQGNASVTKQFGGLGLGLAICASLVSMHKGSIRAESQGEGKGATFVIELPCSSRPSVSMPTGLDAEKEHHSQPTRLLLVDDHSDTLKTLSKMLRRAGFDVLTAENVAMATAMASSQSFDLLVSDLGLPDGDGYQVMRLVRDTYHVPGIAMSGYGMEEDLRRSREAGFSEHLVKPIDFKQLVAAIERVTLHPEESEHFK